MAITSAEMERRLHEADAHRLKLRRTTREFEALGREVRQARQRQLLTRAVDADRP